MDTGSCQIEPQSHDNKADLRRDHRERCEPKDEIYLLAEHEAPNVLVCWMGFLLFGHGCNHGPLAFLLCADNPELAQDRFVRSPPLTFIGSESLTIKSLLMTETTAVVKLRGRDQRNRALIALVTGKIAQALRSMRHGTGVGDGSCPVFARRQKRAPPRLFAG